MLARFFAAHAIACDVTEAAAGRPNLVAHIEGSDPGPHLLLCGHTDIVSLAKGVASGLPLGVTTAGNGLMAWPPGAHGSTFGGNPSRVGRHSRRCNYCREQLVANAARVGDRARERDIT